MKTVFLSGPMSGLDRQTAQKWRQDAALFLEGCFKTVSPYRGREEKETFPDPKGAVVRDKNDILKCDVVIVNDTFENATMIGTAMELLYAYEHEKPIIVFGEAHKGDYFLDYHATIRVDTLEEACNICKTLFHDA